MHYSDRKSKRNKPQYILNICIALFAVICALPILLVFIASFSTEESILTKGFSYFPSGWTLNAYKYIATFSGQLVNSYAVSIYEVVCGTALTLLLCSMFGYVLTKKDFVLTRVFTMFLIITMFVNSGPLAGYVINSNVYHLRNNLLVLIIPGCVAVYNVVMMRTFIQLNVPDGLTEAAKIDGAGDCYTFFRIVLPLMKPVLAAIGFMGAVGHWNEWQTALLYIDNPKFATLQLMLIKIEKNVAFLTDNVQNLSADQMKMKADLPSESCRMATLICTVLPVMVCYPFFQKYFVKGITVGSIKG